MPPKLDHTFWLFHGLATGSAALLGIQEGGTDTGQIHWQGQGGER